MVIVWGLIFRTLDYIFLTSLFSLKYLGEMNLLKNNYLINCSFWGYIIFHR